MIKECSTCGKTFSPRKEPMILTELPQYPWQKVGVDLFQLKGSNYLLVVDYYSRYPEVHKLNSTTADATTHTPKSTLPRPGIPETVTSDNGPQFSSQSFADYARRYDFQHTTTSPLYAQSNGQAERTVQTVKRLLEDSTDPYLALLTYRSTPFPWCMRSPAELLMGRRLRANIPVHSTQLIPDWSYVEEFSELNQTFKGRRI
jgi:transposase InsO family protein